MKGGKDEEKVMGPLFPRLHVNDTERGGPRAPPRNKMALYEQLSIPSQRLNSAGASGLPDKRHITRTVVPSASLGQGGGQERRVFSPFYIPSLALDHSTQKVLPRSSDGTDLDATRMELERKSTKNVSSRALNITGHFLSSVEGSSTHPKSSSNSKNSCGKKVGDEDEFKVPTYSHLGITPYSSKDQQSGGRESPTPFPLFQGCSMVIATNSPQKCVPTTCTSSSQLEKNLDMPLKEVDTTNQKLRQHGRNPVGEQPVETVAAKDHMENSASHPSTAEKNEEPSKYARISLNEEQEARARFLANNDSVGGVSIEPRCYTSNAVSERGNVSRVWKEPYSGASLRTSHVSPTEARNCNEKTKEVEHQSLQVGKVDRNDDISDTSMVDSISGLDISPDDVVGVIGQKHFWKARRAIVNQQRVFAVQVFELHRLIKVQKFIASSPHLLLEDYPYLGRPSLKVLAKQLPSDIVKSQQQIRKPKDDSQKPSQSTDRPTETVVGKTLLPPVNDGIRKGQSQISNNGPCPGNLPPPAPVAAENKPDAWRFHPPGNQWLVPVMSPSEGLVYKPYTGSCPLPAGFMAPVYGSSGPVGLPPFTAYGVSAARPQPGVGVISCAPAVVPNYFPPYSMLAMNPIAPSQAVEQVNTSGGARPYEPAEQISVREVNLNMHSGISCNMSNQKSEAFSCPVLKIPTSEGSEVQGSTGSSPIDREQRAGHDLEGRNALPRFPMAPSVECSDQNHHADSSDQQIHAIKVVPHNPRSATESAARIFQSIQEERQQFHSM